MNAPLQDDPVLALAADNYLERLVSVIQDLRSAVIAYSGGVDSTLLLHAAKRSGIPFLAVTAFSEIMPEKELHEASQLARDLGVAHRVIHTEELSDPAFVVNSQDRCFRCKDVRLGLMKALAREEGFESLADGSNADDFSEWRPGLKALRLHGVRSPLKEAGLTKEAVRNLARRIGIPVWAKPSSPCLCTRIPFGSQITRERLGMIGDAEDFLKSLGFQDVRVRAHDDLARIEVDRKRIADICEHDVRESVARHLRNLGFVHVAIDLQGRRTGSLNPAGTQPTQLYHE